jgi:hypothetical protein
MPTDYRSIASDPDRLERIAEKSIRTLTNLYAEPTHFIFELLQNAEDALRRRGSDWRGSRVVRFHLSNGGLRVAHFGEPFNGADVQAICSVGETTKDLTDIGSFGIGFKSVYAVTDRPEIHSGAEDFAIERFVRPVAAPPIQRDPEETVFLTPVKPCGGPSQAEITAGLKRLGSTALLFLRQIEEIHWSAGDGHSGTWLRGSNDLDAGVRRVMIIGQADGVGEVDEEWLVFSCPVALNDGRHAGHVEVAFRLVPAANGQGHRIERLTSSRLVVFFPTIVETHLGFLVQGPYRTTPARDNVPDKDPWNQHLAIKTAELVVSALRWLRDREMLDVGVVRCLPLDRAKFPEGSLFAPVFEKVREALIHEPLVPRHGGGHAAAKQARLARTQEMRELLSPAQLTDLLGADEEVAWLSADISQERTPDLREYLMKELGVDEVRPEAILPKLSPQFLEKQPDDWVRRLYEFLGNQKALLQRAKELPLVRLSDGKHVRPYAGWQPQAFLPGKFQTGFPTVHSAVCSTDEAQAFLRSLGLTEPHPVDDVVRNVLPRYRQEGVDIPGDAYATDIQRIRTAFATDSERQRNVLLDALRDTPFVRAVDAATGSRHWAKPSDLYVATERLKRLFEGVPGVLFVDDSVPCLRGEDLRELLEACGAVRYLRPIADTSLPWKERRKLREQAGHAETSGYNDRVTDWNLLGLGALLDVLPQLAMQERRSRAGLLWEELSHLEERRGKGVFVGEYTWTHYGSYRTNFDAAFIRLLNEKAWVPDTDGNLEPPELILFGSLDWKPNPFLQSKIRFKSPVIETLAREAGIEPGVLDLLKKHGVTTEGEVRALLRLKEGPKQEEHGSRGAAQDAIKKLLGDAPQPTAPAQDTAVAEPSASGGDGESSGAGHGARTSPGSGHGDGRGARGSQTPGTRASDSAGGGPFISYVAVHSEEEEPDPDGLDQQARMALEAKAIDLILSHEPEWRRTPTHNPGYDLYKADENGTVTSRCEVKAMTGSLEDRPVGLSRTQFDCAREHGEAYWLYVVEHAGTGSARIIRIQDPAGKARTFTFDRGWLSVAQIECTAQKDVARQD